MDIDNNVQRIHHSCQFRVLFSIIKLYAVVLYIERIYFLYNLLQTSKGIYLFEILNEQKEIS